MYDFSTTAPALKTEDLGLPVESPGPAPLTASAIRQAIEGWEDLKPSQRRPLLTAINHVEDILAANRTQLAGHAPWSCAGLNRVLWARPHLAYGLTKDAFRNMLSSLRFVLIRLGLHADSGHRRNRLSPAWQALHAALPSDEYRKGLIRFFRFLTLEGITPETILPNSIEQFDIWCRNQILYEDATGLSRRTAGNWAVARRDVPRWPQVELHRVGMRDQYAIAWDKLTPSFQAEAQHFLDGLAAGPGALFKGGNPFRNLVKATKDAQLPASGGGNGGRKSPRSAPRALAPRTIETRRWQIQVAVTALVASDVQIGSITSLAMLVTPLANPISILHFHRERLRNRSLEKGVAVEDQDLKSSKLKGIGELLRQIAKFEAKLPRDELAELMEYIAMVSPEEQTGMSEKNRIRLKQLFAQPTYSVLLNLPAAWVNEPMLPKNATMTPRDAALLVMYAAALEVLMFLPLRRNNLLQLKLDVHLRRPSPNALINEIAIPASMVKNRNPILWPVETDSARLLDIYIRKYRPLLAKEGNDYLFPGIGDSHRNDPGFGSEFAARVSAQIGAEFNCHLVRHFAVVRYLRKNPGAYEIAANILGHKNPETTRKFYCGLELDAAARHANALLTEERRTTKVLALGAYKRPFRARRGRAGAGA
jgi:integrase